MRILPASHGVEASGRGAQRLGQLNDRLYPYDDRRSAP